VTGFVSSRDRQPVAAFVLGRHGTGLTETGYCDQARVGGDLVRLLSRWISVEVPAFPRALANTWCLILDVSMPDMSGPQLQGELSRRHLKIPIIFIAGDCDRDLRAKLLARGAVECLFKPVGERALRAALDCVIRSACDAAGGAGDAEAECRAGAVVSHRPQLSPMTLDD
jgi:DNA-binding response OmpR family regulator